MRRSLTNGPLLATPDAMRFKIVLAVCLLAVPAAFASQSPTTNISNEDAASLFNALSSIKDGLSGPNIGVAAQDIWALKALAEEFGTQQNKLQIAQSRANAAKDIPTEMEKALKEWDSYRQAVVPVALVPLTPFTDQELKDAKITPALLSPIQHYLFPKP